jgi:hypothetical protein
MNTISFKIVVFFSLFAIGCSPAYYKPNLMTTPNFREKGEVHLAAHLADAGYDGEAAYALTNNVFIQGSIMVQSATGSSSSSSSSNQKSYTVKGQLGEVAVGYFMPVKKYGTLSVCGGYGMGNVNNNWSTDGASSANISKLFIQPSIGVRRKHFDLVLSAKLANLTYSNLSQNYTQQSFITEFNALKSPIPIFETATVLRFGSENIKVQLSASSVSLLKRDDSFRYEGSSVGLGLCVQLNPKKDFKTSAQ